MTPAVPEKGKINKDLKKWSNECDGRRKAQEYF